MATRRKKISDETKKIALDLQESLVNKGHIVHRCDDYLGRTIYLKVDYGLGNTIRISEVPDKSKYGYLYNVRMDLKTVRERVVDGNIRMYYPYDNYDGLVENIDTVIKNTKDKYGMNWYNSEIERRENDRIYNLYGTGFWRNAYRVV